jgi:hypothetical protein
MRMIFGAIGGMEIGRENRSTRRKPTPAPHCPPQNPTWQTWFRTPDRSGGKPATNRLSYDAAFFSPISSPLTTRRLTVEVFDPASTRVDLGTSWRLVVSFTPRPLYPRWQAPPYPFDRRLGGSQSQSGRHWEVKIPAHTGTRTATLISLAKVKFYAMVSWVSKVIKNMLKENMPGQGHAAQRKKTSGCRDTIPETRTRGCLLVQ